MSKRCAHCGWADMDTCNCAIQKEMRRLRQALLESQAEVARLKKPWRPISEAPKDGTRVDLRVVHSDGVKRHADCWYSDNSKCWLTIYGDFIFAVNGDATHYTPIPDIEGEKK